MGFFFSFSTCPRTQVCSIGFLAFQKKTCPGRPPDSWSRSAFEDFKKHRISDFPTFEEFKKSEDVRFSDMPTNVIYHIRDVVETPSRFMKTYRATLADDQGNEYTSLLPQSVRIAYEELASKERNKDKEIFLLIKGKRMAKTSGNEYYDFQMLAR